MDAARIEANLREYRGGQRLPTERDASFDYCFNYFQSHREEGRVAALAEGPSMQLSCLQLGFYLASWGMFRGSTDLLRRSVKHFEPVVKVIADAPGEVWEIDADGYSDVACTALLKIGRRIREAFPERASDTLVTKIMLGVFGSVPAFDTYFARGFHAWTFGMQALQRVGDFYQDNAEMIERHREQTLDFDTGKSTDRRYSRAKVIDMIFYIEGGGGP